MPTDEKERPLTAAGALAADEDRKKLHDTPWDALPVDWRLERMREVVKEIKNTIQWHSRRFEELAEQLRALEEHTHGEGRVLIPLTSKWHGGTGGDAVQQRRVEGWF